MELGVKKNEKFSCYNAIFPSEDSFRGSYVYDQVNEIRKQTGAKITVIRINRFLDKDNYSYNYNGLTVSLLYFTTSLHLCYQDYFIK